MLGQFTITLREAFEASLIISIILAYLYRTKREKLTKYVMIGVYSSIIIGILLGLLIWVTYGVLNKSYQVLFESLASFLAVIVLTSMIYWMATKGKHLKGEIEKKIELTLTKGTILGLTIFSFIIVFREVLETVLFLTPFLVSSVLQTIYGIILGLFFALILSYGIFKVGMKINIRKFFYYTSFILILLAGGLAGYGTHEFIEYLELNNIETGWFGEYAYVLPIDSDNLLHHKNVIGSIFAVMFGYTVKAEWGRLLIHILYLIIAVPLTLKSYKK